MAFSIPDLIFLLCGGASILGAILLYRSYRKTKSLLLLYSTLCFTALFIANILLILDKVVGYPGELVLYRNILSTAGMTLLLWGFIWEGF